MDTARRATRRSIPRSMRLRSRSERLCVLIAVTLGIYRPRGYASRVARLGPVPNASRLIWTDVPHFVGAVLDVARQWVLCKTCWHRGVFRVQLSNKEDLVCVITAGESGWNSLVITAVGLTSAWTLPCAARKHLARPGSTCVAFAWP